MDAKKALCPFCSYEWEKKKDRPKACPRCKRRLDCLPMKPRKALKAQEKALGAQEG